MKITQSPGQDAQKIAHFGRVEKLTLVVQVMSEVLLFDGALDCINVGDVHTYLPKQVNKKAFQIQ